MPRPTRTRKVDPPNAFVSSAARVTATSRRGNPLSKMAASGWQAEAWEMLDTVGELEFYREWIANALSRCALRVVETVINADGERERRPVTEGLPADALAAFFDGDAGQPQMLATLAGHLSIPGESWLVGLVEPSTDPDGPDQWRILSSDEVKQEGSKIVIERGDGVIERLDDGSREGTEAEALAIRVWRPHPRKWVEAHSSVRSALPILRELVGLTKHIAASIDSRLAGAGMLFMPQEASFTSPRGEGAEAPEGDDPLIWDLIETAATAIRNRGSAEALVPIIVRMPAQYLQHIKHITFSTPLDEKALALRAEAIERLATSLDVPADVLKGMGDINHWGQWFTDETNIKMHIEPLGALIAHAVTTRYLWPVLQGDAPTFDPALRRYEVECDTSALRQRPNRSAEAQALHANLTLTDAALARETGLDESDLLLSPGNEEEMRRRLLLQTARTAATPEVALAALEALGVRLEVALPDTGPPGVTVEQVTPDPPTPIGGTQSPPADPRTDRAAALILPSEVMVHRALERAWNKAGHRSKGARGPVPVEQVESCLTGAWQYAPRVAAMTGTDPERLVTALHGYTRSLLLTGASFDPIGFAAVLRREVLADA